MIVDLIPTEEQAAIRNSVADVIAKAFPVSRLHQSASIAAGAERARWALLADLGLFGLGLSEADGGVGYGLPEEVTVARELGRGLVSPAVLATMAAGHVARDTVLAAIRSGKASVAFANPVCAFDLAGGGSVPVQVIDGRDANYVLLWDDQGGTLFDAPTSVSHVEALDETVSLARAKLDLSTGRAHIGGPGPARAAGLLLSAYLAGVAEGAFTLAVTYAKLREQFGQPIGSFQAIKHYCAEMARRAEAAVAQTFYATLDATTRRDDDMFEVAAAVRPQLSPWHRQRRPAKFVEPGHRRHKFSAERNFKYLRARRQGDVLVQTSSGQCRYLSAGLQEPECAVLQCALAGRPGGERSASGLHADSAADLRSGRAHPRFRSRGDLPGEEILVDRCFGAYAHGSSFQAAEFPAGTGTAMACRTTSPTAPSKRLPTPLRQVPGPSHRPSRSPSAQAVAARPRSPTGT